MCHSDNFLPECNILNLPSLLKILLEVWLIPIILECLSPVVKLIVFTIDYFSLLDESMIDIPIKIAPFVHLVVNLLFEFGFAFE